ncbi:MAG: MarR family transcriptional regulator [Aestuariivirgaceae bacterium]|nr:MarR family transcriptional regulator [Aestuariivirgaceae bacterium]
MADINSQKPGEAQVMEFIELLFFAYRDFISDPDDMLTQYGFGRAHHRVLHFVGRNPGMRVADLLDILRITKQSLGRVLRELIEKEFVYQTEGAMDRRQRLLHLTPTGEVLRQSLMRPQMERVGRALEGAGTAREVLLGLINEDVRPQVHEILAREAARRAS